MAKRDPSGLPAYGQYHIKARERWARWVKAVAASCWRCGKPIPAGAKWDLGHVDEAGRLQGFPARHPEHRACNRATVTILKQKLAAAESPPSTASREW